MPWTPLNTRPKSSGGGPPGGSGGGGTGDPTNPSGNAPPGRGGGGAGFDSSGGGVDDLLIAGRRSLNDSLITAVQGVWKTSQPEHLGPDADCVPVNLERVDAGRSEELNLPMGSILLSQVEYIIELLMDRVPT